jgi:precorrin-6x reductase
LGTDEQSIAEPPQFTDEELEFIINYDIKYRVGKDAGEEGGE